MKKGFLLIALCFVCIGQIVAQNVARIGTTEYATLQAAVDAAYATTGDVTIEMIADIEAYTVIKQKEGLNLTIDGNNKAHTITGQIFIDGCNRSTGTETLTITGIIFTGDGTGAGFYDKNFISMPNVKTPTTAPYYHNVNNYAHNVTVSNCSFNSTSASKDMVGVRVGSKGGGGYNTVVINVEGDNLHSFGQFAAANGTTITNCSATNTKSFINFGDGGNVTNTISNCTFSSSETDSYAVREKGNSASNILLSNNNFTAEKVIWLGEDDAPSGIITVESGTYNGSVYNGMNASGTGEIILTGGTYNQPVATVQGYCADGYLAIDEDPEPGYCTVRKQFVVTFNNNGGEGDMDPAYVNPATGEFVVPACTFTNGEWTFDKWNTKADGTGTDLNVDDVMTLTSDTILYAQWRGVAKIGDTHYTTLNAAAAAVPVGTPTTITILQNLNFYDIAQSNIQNKTITFTGTATDTLTLTNAAHLKPNASGADLTFENITLKNDNTADNFAGIIHVSKITCNDCEILGFMNGYANQFTCNNCTFTASCKFHMWTYGSNCTFNSCTFNSSYSSSGGKAINVFTDQTYDQRVIAFNDCAFNAINHSGDGSAIQINSRYTCFVIYANNCTVTGYSNTSSTAVPGYENLANNKKEVTDTKTTLYVDGIQILKEGSCDPVAKIGETYYNTLQDAADDARANMTGDVTIELLKNTEEDVTIRQKAGLNYIIEGNNDTLNGRIFVDGGRIFPNPVGEVTITNLNFTYNAGLTYSADNRGFVCNSQNNLSYAAHVTVSNCTFDGGDPANSMAAYRDPASAQSWDITLDHLVAKNCHSLVQATSVSGMAITNCNATDNVKNGINISGGGSDHIPGVTNIYTIANDTLACNTDGEYSIRIQEHGRATDTFKLADNMFTAPKAIISKHNTACVIAASSGLYDGDISLESSDAATFSFTGGTFSEPKATVDGYCAYGYAAVANDPDDEHCTVRKLEVARIGTTTYPYLQDALDSARTMTGDVTIELLENITEIAIVRQKAGLNLTIEGNNDTITGQIIIHGDGRLNDAETLTIQNVNFTGNTDDFLANSGDAFITAPKTTVLPSPFTGTGNGYNYCHNITISGCSFTSTSTNADDYDVVAFKASSGKNITIDNCKGDNLHSLAQFTGTTNGTITNDTITNSQSFVNVSGGAGNFTISNCAYTGAEADDGYAVRENGSSSANITLSDNNFTANKVLVLGKGGAQNPSGTINVESGEYNGVISKETVEGSTSKFSFTGGIFDEDSAVVASWCAPGYLVFKYSDSPERWIVERAYMFVYDKNAATAVGTMDTIIVRQSATEADRTFEVAACEFTRSDGYAFDIWNTRPDSSGNGFEPGDNIIIVSDTTLYAIWKEGYTVFYDNNGGTGHIAPQPKYIGEDIILSDGAAFSRTDSTLYRWNTEANESGDSYELGGTYSADANATMYAVWRLNLGMTMASTDVVCYGENNGTDTVKIIGGDPTYMIVLSSTVLDQNDTVRTSETQYVFTNLKPGTYNVELSDTLKKDFITGSFIIKEPDTLVASFVSVPEKPCPLMGAGTYEVAMTSEGGNGGNVYTWGGDATDVNDTATTITPDEDDRDRTYNITVTVTDQKGCTAVIDTSFTVSPVIANDETAHSNTIMTIATINQSILYGCDTIIRDFGTPSFTFTNAAITEAILDTVYNNVSTAFPDSIFTLGENKIIWTAIDTCGHEVTAEQVVNITHKPCPSAFDYHGIEYPAVRIGCDCWTTKNLASTQYSDGDQIPDVRSYPINTRASVYGNLYTYEAAMDGADVAAAVASNTPVQGACPAGWHVPSQAEAEALMSSAEVVALMSQGTWLPDNGTNSTGFTMLPGGFYNSELDRYERMYVSAYIWIATPETAIYHACEFGAACSSLELIPGNLADGLSIRCVITKPAE